MRRLRAKHAACLLAAALLVTTPVQAATGCWDAERTSAAKLRDFQSRLVAATLRCRAARHDILPSYNGFVRANMARLQGANMMLKDYFAQGYGTAGQAEYDRFVTRLANGYGGERTNKFHCDAMKALADEAAAAGGDAPRLLAISDRLGTGLVLPGVPCPATLTLAVAPAPASAAPAPTIVEATAPSPADAANAPAPAPVPAQQDGALRQAVAIEPAEAPAPAVALRVDIREVEGGVEVAAELPGVSSDDIDVDLRADALTIAGQKRSRGQGGAMQLAERNYGAFQRSIPLPFAPDPEQVRAHFSNGVLTVTLLRPATEQSRRIEIRSGPLAPID